jgi:hypothetical protein
MGVLMKPTKEQIQEYYGQAIQRCLETFSKLDDREWGKKVDGGTARDTLANLVGTHLKETMVLTRQALAGEPQRVEGFEKREQMAAFREATVKEFRDKPTSELLQMLKDNYEEHLKVLDSLSESDLDKPAMSPSWDRPGTIRDLFFASYLFLPGQYQEIRKAAKKKMPHWVEASTPEQVNYHMSRIFHYMPLIFRSDRGGDMKATYVFTMEGDGGGQWSVKIADGRAESEDGGSDPFDLELKTKPELWIDLSTGELNAAWAIMTRKVQLGGNAGLAMKLGDLFTAAE